MMHAETTSLTERPASTVTVAPEVLAGARYAAPLPSGARLQEFEISAVIGQGGFGIVYLARDLSLQRSVAIKEYFPAHLAGRDIEGRVRALAPSQAEVLELGRRSFINEARMLARFKHSGLVEVLRFWEQNGTAYMAMPFYDGATLTQYLKRHPGVATEAWLRKTLKPLVEALGHMHQEYCFHRDVAPDNILILKDGSAVLLDLGAARRVIANDAQAMTVMLKPGYAPIEQYSDDPRFRQGPWTDIYAMAAVLFFAVTGKAPPASASRVMRDSVSPLSSVRPEGYSESFLLAIDKGLSLQPDDRPRSIAEFGALLFSSPQPLDAADRTKLARRSAPGSTEAYGSRYFPAASASDSGGESGAVADTSVATESTDAVAAPQRSFAGRPAMIAAGAAALALIVAGGLFIGGREGDAVDNKVTERTAPATGSVPVVASVPVAAVAEAPASEPAMSSPVTPGSSQADRPVDVPALKANVPEPKVPAAATIKPVAAPPAAPALKTATAAAMVQTPAAKADSDGKSAAVGSGTVELAVKPWAEIRVNGVLKGVSPPLRQLTLPAGKHMIEMRNPAATAPVKQQVEIRANQKAVLSHQF